VSKFARYIWGTLAHPAATFRYLSQEENVRQGWGAVLLLGVLYSVVCAIAAANGIEPVAEPFLPISKESYYFWEIFFAPPVMIGAWYLFSYLNLRLGRAFCFLYSHASHYVDYRPYLHHFHDRFENAGNFWANMECLLSGIHYTMDGGCLRYRHP